MNKDYSDFVEKLINDNDCIVKVIRSDDCDDDGTPYQGRITIDFLGKSNIIYTYMVDQEYTSTIRLKEVSEGLIIPSYLFMLYVFCDIQKECRLLNISPNLVRYYKGDVKYNSISQIIDNDKSHHEIQKHLDACISAFVTKGNTDFEVELPKMGLLTSWRILKGILI